MFSIICGLFLIFKGVNKHFLSSCKVFDLTSTISLAYQQVIAGMCESEMLKVASFLQVLSGILLFILRTRLVGVIVLLLIIFQYFYYLFLDNRPEEFMETGISLKITLVIIGFYYKDWKNIFLS